MKKLRNFICDSGAIIERLVDDDTDTVACCCGGDAVKTISAARYLGNTTGKSPGLKSAGKSCQK